MTLIDDNLQLFKPNNISKIIAVNNVALFGMFIR